MSNSGNTLNKKTIIAIVIIAILLIAAIIGVVVFLKDQGETSAMAENGSQTSSDENVQAEQDAQNQEPQEQAQTEEQNADTQNNEQEGESTEVATTNDGANQGDATTGTTSGNSGTGAGTSNSGNNANNNDNDAENIQESVIEETQTVETEETVKTEEGEILSWTPQALAASGVAANIKLNAPNLVTEKTSVVYNDDGTRAEDQTKIALDQKVTYTIIIENRGNIEGTIEKGKTYDTLPKGFDYSKTRAEDYEFKVEKISATGESTTGDEVLSYSDFKFGKENATLESQTLILDKDVKLGAGEKLFIAYSLKVDPKYLEDENGLVANKHIDKNVVTVNNLPVEDKNEYDGVQPLVKVEKTSRILRGEDLKETDIAKIADFIEYTIHIENNGEADTKVTVKDSDLEKILSDGKAEFRSGDKTAEELINGFDVEVAHKDYVDIKFVIEIKDITGAIENGVEVKDTTPQNPDPVVPENPDKVNTVNITATKGIITDGAVYEKDTLTYTITLQNSGNTKGTVSVKDSIPEGLTFKEGSIKINGDETEYTQNDLEDGNIKVTVPGNNGKVVVSFMVTADILDGKESLNIDNTAYVDDEPTNTVTTTVNKAYISVEVNKEWKDNDIQAQRRPDKVTFILVAGGEDTDTTLTVDVSKTSDKQNYKFEKPIAKYNKDGKPIKYTVREEGMGDFYKSTVSKPSVAENGNTAVTVTNEFKLPEGDKNKKDVTVTKIWEDNNNYAGKRTSVDIKITGSDSDKNTKTVTLKDSDAKDNKTWQITVNGMTKYDANGVEIKYTASEEKVPDFYKLVKIEGTTVTNEFELPKDTVNYKVNKVWDDNDIQAQRRPETINFDLTKTVKDKDGNNRQEDVDTKTLTTSKENYVEFKELPKYDDKANVIDYNVTEGDTTSANGENFYESTKSDEKADKDGNIEVTITNKFTLEYINNKTDITVTKVWDDENNKAQKRTDKVILDVIGKDRAEEVKQENIELTAENADPENSNVWSTKVSLQKYDQDGKLIVYSAKEQDTPKFYTKSENGTKVTNKFVGDETTTKDIKITKKWEDNNNKAKKRPQSVKFIISSDVLDFKYEETLSEGKSTSNEWTKTIKVRKYDDNANEIEYTLDEEEVSKGELYFYKADVDKENFTITNTFKVPDDKVTVKVNKLWDDEGHEGKRPDKIKFVLTSKVGNEEAEYVDEEVRDVNTEDNFEFDNLPKYNEDGDVISYDVNEVEVNDNELFFYESEKTENTENNFQFTNTFRVPTGEENEQDITIKKVWDDNDDKAEKRPENVKLTLNENDYTLNAYNDEDKDTKDEWTLTVLDQAIYDSNGDKIIYTVEEKTENIPTNYEVKDVDDGPLTVTNEFKVNEEKTDLTLVKKWNDNDDNERPSKVTFAITGTSTTGKTTEHQEVTAKDGWTKTLKVNKYDEYNNPITYSVEEVNVENGYVSSTPSKGNNNTWTVTNTLPSMTVDKKVSEIIKANGDVVTPDDENSTIAVAKDDIIKYTITVTNNTDIPLTDVVVTDKDLQITSDQDGNDPIKDGIVIKLTEQLVKGQPATVDVYYKVTDSNFLNDKQIRNTVNAEGKYIINGKEYTVEDSDSETVSVEQVPGISIKKTQKVTDNAPKNPGYVGEGDKIEYTITVKNTGNTVLKDINIVDEMSGQSGKLNIEKSDLTIDTLEPTKTKDITATYTVTKDDISKKENHKIVNYVTVTAKDSESDKPVSGKDKTTPVETEIGAPDISLEKESKLIKADKNIKHNADGTEYQGNQNVAEPGDTIKYTITVKNDGNVTGTATVGDEIPDGTKFSKFITKGIKLENDAFSTEVEVGPKGTSSDTKTIEFEVTVTAKAGTTIKNTATLDGTPSGNTTENKVEKTVKVTTNTTTQTIKNSNVVIVLDVSTSMNDPERKIGDVCTRHNSDWRHRNAGCVEVDGVWHTTSRDSRINIAKEVVQNFIDSMNFATDGNGCAVSVVTFWGASSFYDPASGMDYSEALNVSRYEKNTIADTPEEATYLADTAVENVKTKSGTCISGALQRAKQQMELLKSSKPQNNNIVIFVGDGEPSADKEEHKISDYARELQNVAKSGVYAIGFGINSSTLRTIASSTDKYYTTANGNIDLSGIFTQIGEDLSDPVENNEVSNNGLVELDNIDTSKDITITVDGENEYKGNVSGTDYIEQTGGTYYLDTTQFDAGAEIEITYTENS